MRKTVTYQPPRPCPTGPHRPDAPGAFAILGAILAIIAAIVAISVFGSGCAAAGGRSDAVTRPLVVGERVRVVRAGETVVVPEPEPPARTWYLADDEGLWQWLGIRAPNRVFVTNDDQRVALRRKGDK